MSLDWIFRPRLKTIVKPSNPGSQKTIFFESFSGKTIFLVRVSNQQFQDAFLFMVFDFQG